MAANSLVEGTVTLLFTDVEGSTAMRTGRGDDAAQAILKAHEALIREQIAAHGGQEIKALGDGFMVGFASARKAVSCAVGIQRAMDNHAQQHPDDHARVRIGLNSGEVVQENGDLMGAAVNLAARITAKADGGQILVSGVVKDLAGRVPDVSFANRGRFRLKGFPERWQLFEVVWKREQAPAEPVPVERTPLIGRDSERDELLRALAEAEAGRGGVALIGGEPGIGKSRLAQELMAEANTRGFRALLGHCIELEGGAPYMPFVEVLESAIKVADPDALRVALGDAAPEVARVVPHLRRIFADIPTPLELPPEQERRYLFNSIHDFIARAAEVRPQLVVLDDLHWADEATVLLLQHLAERAAGIRLLIVGTYRDTDLDSAKPFARALEDFLRRRLALRVRLRGLPQEAVATILGTLVAGQPPPAKLVDAIYAETEGNPFFVEEVFQHLHEEGRLLDAEGAWRPDLAVSDVDVPEGIRLVIGRRLDRLSEDARKCLTTAAVVGRRFSYRLLEAAADLDSDTLLDAVDAAERARLIAGTEETETSFEFSHELVRQTLLTNVSMPRRQRLHLRVADAMEATLGAAAEERAPEMAHHLFLAGEAADADRTARYLVLAGDQALASAAFEEALGYFRDALSVLGWAEARGRAEALAKLGFAQMDTGHWDEAIQSLTSSMDQLEELGEHEMVGSICRQLAFLLSWIGRFQEAIEIAGRGLSALGDNAPGERSALLALSGAIFAAAGGYEVACRMADEAVEIARGLNQPMLLGTVLSYASLAYWWFQELNQARRLGDEAVALLRAEGGLWELANLLGFLAFTYLWVGDPEGATVIRAEVREVGARIGHYGALMVDHRFTELRSLASGDLDAAATAAQEDLRICQEAGLPWFRDTYLFMAAGAFSHGDWEGALQLCRDADTWDIPYGNAVVPAAMASMYLAYLGRRDEAMRGVEGLMDDFPLTDEPTHWGIRVLVGCAVESLLVLNETARLREIYPVFASMRSGSTVFQIRGFDSRLTLAIHGAADAAAGDWDASAQAFTVGRREAAIWGLRTQADLDYWEAWATLQRGQTADRDKASRLLGQAIESYRKLGMLRHVAMAEGLAGLA